MGANDAGSAVAKGFFGAMPSEKLMTIGGVGSLLSFGGQYMGLPLIFYSGAGAVFIIVMLMGFYGTVLRAKKEDELKRYIRTDRRQSKRSERTPSGRTMAFCRLLTEPMDQLQIARLPFSDDDKLTKAAAIQRVKLSRGVDAGVPSGLVVELPNGKYISRDFYPLDDKTILGDA